MRLRFGKAVEQKSHSENSLSDCELSLLYLLMSQHKNISEHGHENGGHDPIDQEIIRSLRIISILLDKQHPHALSFPSTIIGSISNVA